jgi:hypothetical protein
VKMGDAMAYYQCTSRLPWCLLLAGVAVAMTDDHGATRTHADASKEYYWRVFLKGYCRDESEAKEEFNTAAKLNRKQRRRLEAKSRRLRNKVVR